MSNDHKTPKLSKQQQEIAQVLRYVDQRLQNHIEQIRAVAMAAGVTPELFQKFFVDEDAQEDFYIKLHVAEDNYALQKKAEIAAEKSELGESAATPSIESPSITGTIAEFTPPALSEKEVLQGEQGGAPI